MCRPESDPRAGEILNGIARAAIEAEFGPAADPDLSAEWLAAPGASFVTLARHGRLRGCIGSLQAHRRLGDDVAHNARAAAFDDTRFEPLTARELAGLRIEVSVLAEPEPLSFGSQADALQQLRPGIDGLVLAWRGHRATFLPQVWRDLPDRAAFLNHLKRKAGLPPSFWDDRLELRRYTVTSWDEPDSPSGQP